jgi:protease IV
MSDFGTTGPGRYAPPPLPYQDRTEGPELSGRAVASVVFGLFGLFTWALGAIPALILSLIALSDIRNQPERYRGRGTAVFGLVLGLIGMVAPLFFALMLLGAMISAAGSAPMAASGDRLIHIRLDGMVVENPADAVSPFFGATAVTLADMVDTIRTAAADEEIQGLILTLSAPGLGMAQAEEVRAAVLEFREADKPVYVHGADLSTGSYALLTAGSHLNLVPTDTLWLTGLHMQSFYLAEGLEKIGVRADMLQSGAYKSANEMFERNEPSEAAAENTAWLLDGYFDVLLAWIAEGRGIDETEARMWIDRGPYSAEDALERGLIDSVSHLDTFLSDVRAKHGEDVYIDNYYNVFPTPPTGWDAFRQSYAPTEPAVGVVYASGVIIRGYSESTLFGNSGLVLSGDLMQILEWAGNDDDIGAVVLRVDSPGGSVTASEEILRAIERLQEKKPVVVSMGNVAASGGYYIACKADAIYADAMTVTGSIGVISGKIVLGGLWEELGIHWHTDQRGANADIFDPNKPWSDAQRAWFRSMMDDAYAAFTGHVEAGRGRKLTKPMNEIAEGRVFTGSQALALGLIDTLGGLEDAIAHAAELAELDDYEVRVLPEPMTFWETLMASMQGGYGRWSDLDFPNGDDEARALRRGLPKPEVPSGAGLGPVAEILGRLQPLEARAALEALNAAELMRREPTVALMPSRSVVR